MAEDGTTIFAEIEAVLADATPPLDALEDTLTAGYAAALALEAERWRIERGISAAAASLGSGSDDGQAQEIANLARRLDVAEGDLARLRELLATLRDRASAARAA